jgi:hypothetical protein
VAVNQRPPRHHVVDEGVAVDIFEDGAGAASNEQRRPANRLKRAHGAVDPAGQHSGGAGEQLL